MFLTLVTHFSFFIILAMSVVLTFIFLRRFKDYKIILKFVVPILLSLFWLLPAVVESQFWHGIFFVFLLVSNYQRV